MGMDSITTTPTKRANAFPRSTPSGATVDSSVRPSGENGNPSYVDGQVIIDVNTGPGGRPTNTTRPSHKHSKPSDTTDTTNPELFINPFGNGTDGLYSNGTNPSQSTSTDDIGLPSNLSSLFSNGADPSSVSNSTALSRLPGFDFNSTTTTTTPPSPEETSSPGSIFRRLRAATSGSQPKPVLSEPESKRVKSKSEPAKVKSGQDKVRSRRAIAKAKLARDQN
jgi:hypothetical protein